MVVAAGAAVTVSVTGCATSGCEILTAGTTGKSPLRMTVDGELEAAGCSVTYVVIGVAGWENV